MKPSEIADSYDQIADRWVSDSFSRDNGIEAHQRAIAFVESKHRALDVGCGSSGRFIDLLTSHGFRVEGLDISPRMVDLAKRRHPDVIFHVGDVVEWTLPHKFDLISAWDSIWHVPLLGQESVLRKLSNGLNRRGVLIFTMGGLDEPSEKVDTEMGPSIYYATLGIPKVLEVLSDAGCICRHLEFDHYPELHLYVIAQKR